MVRAIQSRVKTYVQGVFGPFASCSPWFFGLALYRAWIGLSIDHIFWEYPEAYPNFQQMFAMVSMAVLVLCALFYRRLTPILEKNPVILFSVACLMVSTACSALAVLGGSYSMLLFVIAAVLGGVGISGMILLWSELYSCLNPVRVIFYYSGSLLATEVVLFLLSGYSVHYLFGWVFVLPALSVMCLKRAYRSIPSSDRPKSVNGSLGMPWKAILLMALYAFAMGFGTEQRPLAEAFGTPGVLVSAGIVFLGVLLRNSRLNMSLTFQGALSCMVIGFLLVPLVLPGQGQLMGLFASMSYTAFSILIMLIFCGLCFRTGVSAVLLFAVERSVRTLCITAGRSSAAAIESNAVGDTGVYFGVAIAVLVLAIVVSFLLYGDRKVSSLWGMNDDSIFEDGSISEADRLRLTTVACARLSAEYGLTNREQEVLLLLAKGKTMKAIGEELFIAMGTTKAHIGHIYDKVGVHSRDELRAVLEEIASRRLGS